MDIALALLINFAVALGLLLIVWLVCLALRDATIVDAFWAFGHIAVAIASFVQATEGYEPRKLLILGLCVLWGLRLGGYMLWRWRAHGPDRRYASLIGKAGRDRGWGFAKASLLLVFLTQAPVLWLSSLPAQLGQFAATPAALGPLAWIGAAVALFGLAYESVADFQMQRFRARPDARDRVMNQGLWRYCRHPNYFGEALVWIGIFLVGAETLPGWFALPGVLFLIWTLNKWSGAATLEPRLTRTRAGYADYVATTNRFIPWPPRKAAAHG